MFNGPTVCNRYPHARIAKISQSVAAQPLFLAARAWRLFATWLHRGRRRRRWKEEEGVREDSVDAALQEGERRMNRTTWRSTIRPSATTDNVYRDICSENDYYDQWGNIEYPQINFNAEQSRHLNVQLFKFSLGTICATAQEYRWVRKTHKARHSKYIHIPFSFYPLFFTECLEQGRYYC